jgi:hypothetical protein
MRDVTLPKETVILKSCVASTMTCGHRMHVSHALMYSPPPNLSRQKHTKHITCRVGQNLVYTPYMTVYLMISLPTIPYIHRIYMVLANPNSM